MPQQLFHLEGPRLADLKAQAALRYGPRALIVSAELVTVGGINGLFARRHYEIVVEVPEDDGGTGADSGGPAKSAVSASVPDADAARPRGRRRAAAPADAIDALLQRAESDEVRLAGGPGRAADPREPADATPAVVSTDSNLFAALMDDLTFTTDPAASVGEKPAAAGLSGTKAARVQAPAGGQAGSPVLIPAASGRRAQGEAREATEHLGAEAANPAGLPVFAGPVVAVPAVGPSIPAVLRAPGDLVVVIGAPAASWDVAHSMADAFGGGRPAAIAVSGPAGRFPRDARPIADRLDANAARAAGVDGGHAVFMALTSADLVSDGRFLLAVRPDQVWLAVDAARKEADTAAWVGAQTMSMERAGLRPAGIAVVGSAETSTPETVDALGLPVGWLDGRPAGAATAAGPAGVGGAPRGTATSRTGPRTTSVVVSPPGAGDPLPVVASALVPEAGTACTPSATPAGTADPVPGGARRRPARGRRRAEATGIE